MRSHGEFWRVLLGLGARRWAGGAKRSQEWPRLVRMSPKGAREERAYLGDSGKGEGETMGAEWFYSGETNYGGGVGLFWGQFYGGG